MQWYHIRQRCVTPWVPPAWLLLGKIPSPPWALSFGQKGLGLGGGVGAAWPMDNLLSAWGPQMGSDKACVLLGRPCCGGESCPQSWPPPPSCLSAPFFHLLPQVGPLLATFQGCGENACSENNHCSHFVSVIHLLFLFIHGCLLYFYTYFTENLLHSL